MWADNEVAVGVGLGCEGKGKGVMQKHVFWWAALIISRTLAEGCYSLARVPQAGNASLHNVLCQTVFKVGTHYSLGSPSECTLHNSLY